MTESKGLRLACPKCRSRMAKLVSLGKTSKNWTPFTDPVDGVVIYRCHTHGRVYKHPDGRLVMGAKR